MKKSEYFAKSLMNAVGVFIYVFAVAWMLPNAKNFFGESPGFIIPMFMMLLLVVSATITGLLVLGKPIYLYLSGFKKEAFILFFATLTWLVVFLVVILVTLLLQ